MEPVEENESTKPTPYRVSTITCNGSLGTSVNLDLLFQHVGLSEEKFVWVEHGTNNNRGTYPKKRRPNIAERKSFDNQVTLIFRVRDGYTPNIKVFRNGNVQMTGIRCPEDGMAILENIAKEVRRIARDTDPGIAVSEEIRPGDFKIRMINSDFSFGFRIRRKDLHMLLISSKYNTTSSFQPGTYPGVKIQYFWNDRDTTRSGRCSCARPCQGRGENAVSIGKKLGSETEAQCKKVTISVFESGKILITGATSYIQIDEAYGYIVKVIQDNLERVKKNALICP